MKGVREQGSKGAGEMGRWSEAVPPGEDEEQRRSSSLRRLLKLIWRPGTLVVLMMAAFALFFGLLAMEQHRAFLTNGLDLGNVDQALWNTAQGRFLHFTLMAPVESRLALHVEPVLLFFVPFYWLGLGGPELLLMAQAVIVALGAWPVYQLAVNNEQLTKEESGVVTFPFKQYPLGAVIFPLVYLLLPTLEAAVLFDFHAITLAPTFLLFAFWALEQKRDGLFIGFALLAMACKEDMPLVVMMLGLYAGLAQRRWRLALVLRRQFAADARYRPWLARRCVVRPRREVPGQISKGAVLSGLDFRHHLRAALGAGRFDL